MPDTGLRRFPALLLVVAVFGVWSVSLAQSTPAGLSPVSVYSFTGDSTDIDQGTDFGDDVLFFLLPVFTCLSAPGSVDFDEFFAARTFVGGQPLPRAPPVWASAPITNPQGHLLAG